VERERLATRERREHKRKMLSNGWKKKFQGGLENGADEI
jgi:hypothetical protein